MKAFFFLVASLVLSLSSQSVLRAQEDLKLTGMVIDRENGSPLPFAHLHYGDFQYGTATNEDGRFQVRIPHELTLDTLFFSYVGYAPFKLPLWKVEQGQDLLISLDATAVQLPSIEITPVDALTVLEEAIDRIPDNYPDHPRQLLGFYRETVQHGATGEYLAYAEGVIKTYKSSYSRSGRPDRIKLEKGYKRRLPYQLFLEDSTIFTLPLLTEGAHMPSILDAVRQRSPFLDLLTLEGYLLDYQGRTELDGRTLQIIHLEPKATHSDRHFFTGRVFVDEISKAIVRLEYDLTVQARHIQNQATEISSGVRLASRNYEVQYFPYQGKWQLQFANVEQTFIHPPSGQVLDCTMYYVVTEIQTENFQPIRRRERIKANEAFLEKVEPVDSSYWENFNILPEKINRRREQAKGTFNK